ncbi:indole-3-glycerol phosphate synthase TrpC [Aestuariimicrobium sp. T2.26MG-19.2B]|uniref:indole-3-glycerol phosphate synthase TrpC n=1 Tax=Aestuariimicrobium sp. T2.26MG-19.2B TaxID=3040679 RepID=UPI0024778CBE|nr:indole-3-glycerol phosphate synthase TrpC [Aestuariimicrobium sp. T2.26MG-19.2B]CAI9410200.1 Indole-3-glycerol phosphate synthase [Aestuariimicrobium sp. T2.26MG-19.2B]
MSVLDSIVAGVREDLAVREQLTPRRDLEALLDRASAPRDPRPAFRRAGVQVIAEVKRSSPSKGALADIPDPASLAALYEAGGAAAISVLTEKRRFGGSLADLDAVRDRVDLPVLRKDFMVTEYQLVEARVHGADLALLIVASLDDAELRRLHRLALDLGLTPLVEVHTPDEAKRAADLVSEDPAGAVIGVNNRNLVTLEVDIFQFGSLVAELPATAIKVAESGLTGPQDVALVAQQGADVVLVGEALVRHHDPAHAIEAMLATSTPTTGGNL